jgi:hypothetical protein
VSTDTDTAPGTDPIVVSQHAARRWRERGDADRLTATDAWNEAQRVTGVLTGSHADETRYHAASDTILIRSDTTLVSVFEAEFVAGDLPDSVRALRGGEDADASEWVWGDGQSKTDATAAQDRSRATPAGGMERVTVRMPAELLNAIEGVAGYPNRSEKIRAACWAFADEHGPGPERGIEALFEGGERS